jgi:hypothetical protein
MSITPTAGRQASNRSGRWARQRVEARTLEQSTLLEVSQTLASELELKPDLILDQLRVILELNTPDRWMWPGGVGCTWKWPDRLISPKWWMQMSSCHREAILAA